MKNRFQKKLFTYQQNLSRDSLDVLQVNLGKLCNIACVHCHVEAGPMKTKENMGKEVASAVIHFFKSNSVKTLDLTGGAPELNPFFKLLVQEARKQNIHVIDRCNLTVLFESGFEDIGPFLAENEVEVIASLPCYSKENVDKQRGKGVFFDSVSALKTLNQLGYGNPKSRLILNLVYNPVGAHLPPLQENLEKEYKIRLKEDFNIDFNHLYTITNMPITRYKKYLKNKDEYDKYIYLLEEHFNSETLENVMCRNTLSVGWDGKIYDCDFNLALKMNHLQSRAGDWTIFDLSLDQFYELDIQTGNHCFGCTAGSGSSCQGALN